MESSNVKAMREALVKVKRLFDGQIMFQPSIREAHKAVNAALAAPPRNCDRFATPKEAGEAFISEACENPCGNCTVSDECHNPLVHECGIEWLFAEAKGGAK